MPKLILVKRALKTEMKEKLSVFTEIAQKAGVCNTAQVISEKL